MKAFMKSKTPVLKRMQELDASETQISNAARYDLVSEGDNWNIELSIYRFTQSSFCID